jgi:hypothetical protein
MQPVQWIAVLGVVAALVLGLGGIAGLTVVSSRQARSADAERLRAERRTAYLDLLAAKARLDQVVPECNAARIAELEGRPLSPLEQDARQQLVPAYRRFGECTHIASAFAGPDVVRTLVPLHRAMTTWINASQRVTPDADRTEAWAVYLRGVAFVRAVRAELGLPDLDEVAPDEERWNGGDTSAWLPAQAPGAEPSRRRTAPEQERMS